MSIKAGLVHPRRPAAASVGQTGSPQGGTASNQMSTSAGRLLDEPAGQTGYRVSGGPRPPPLKDDTG